MAKVLLIEDDAVQAHPFFKLPKQLELEHWDLTRVESVREAEKFLEVSSYDVVVLDLGLADSHGLEAVRRVHTSAPHIPVVLLSSAEDEPIAIQAVKLGSQDYLIKGQFEPRELNRVLLNAMNRHNLNEFRLIEKERAQATLDCIGDAVVCTDIAGNVTFLNKVAEDMTGWTLKDAAGRPMGEVCRILDAITRKPILDPMAKAALQHQVGSLPLNSILVSRDGKEVSIEDSVAPIRDRFQQVTGAVIVFRDVSTMRALKDELNYAAMHDSLTGLPNRAFLNDRIGQVIVLARRLGGHAAVLFLDLDNFKGINDHLGHSIGDRVLQSVAQRLRECVRTPDTVGRLGGDEFVVLLQELHHPSDAAFTAARLLKAVSQVHLIAHQQIYLTASIGISVYPGDGSYGETLFQNADIAMYEAKKDQAGRYHYFGMSHNYEIVERRRAV